MTPDTAMFFAAGLGTRMGELIRDLPKPLLPVGNTTLIDHALDLSRTAGVTHKIVNLHYKADLLRSHLSCQDIKFSSEENALLETGGGLKHALPLLNANPVFTMNTDAVWTGRNPFSELAQAWKPDQMEALLLLVRAGDAFGHTGNGDFLIGESGQLTRGPGPIYCGAQILRTDGLSAIKEPAFSLNLLWQDMIARGTLFGILHEGSWCDVGRPECLALANKMIGYP